MAHLSQQQCRMVWETPRLCNRRSAGFYWRVLAAIQRSIEMDP
jgi:hypothetical protein